MLGLTSDDSLCVRFGLGISLLTWILDFSLDTLVKGPRVDGTDEMAPRQDGPKTRRYEDKHAPRQDDTKTKMPQDKMAPRQDGMAPRPKSHKLAPRPKSHNTRWHQDKMVPRPKSHKTRWHQGKMAAMAPRQDVQMFIVYPRQDGSYGTNTRSLCLG